MSGPHDRAARTAKRAFAKHGRKVQLVSPGGRPTAYGQRPSGPAPVEVSALVLDVEASEVSDTVLAHDRKYLIDGDHDVTAGMWIVDEGGERFDIRKPAPFKPGVTRIYTEVFAGL